MDVDLLAGATKLWRGFFVLQCQPCFTAEDTTDGAKKGSVPLRETASAGHFVRHILPFSSLVLNPLACSRYTLREPQNCGFPVVFPFKPRENGTLATETGFLVEFPIKSRENGTLKPSRPSCSLKVMSHGNLTFSKSVAIFHSIGF